MENNLRVYSWDDIVSGKFFSLSQLHAAGFEGTALTVGGFDGVHLGHQALFEAVLGQKNLLPGVITFGTPPKARLHPEGFSGSVCTMEQRMEAFGKAGFAFVVVIDFSGDFGRMDGVVFIQTLREKLHMAYLAEGTDFRCGYKGAVTIDFLQDFARRNGIGLDVVEPVIADGVRVSSSAIRNGLLEGNLAQCRRFLGRNFVLDGRHFQWQWELSPDVEVSSSPKSILIGRKRAEASGIFQMLPAEGLYQVKLQRAGVHDGDCLGTACIQDGVLKIAVSAGGGQDVSPAHVRHRFSSVGEIAVEAVEFIGDSAE